MIFDTKKHYYLWSHSGQTRAETHRSMPGHTEAIHSLFQEQRSSFLWTAQNYGGQRLRRNVQKMNTYIWKWKGHAYSNGGLNSSIVLISITLSKEKYIEHPGSTYYVGKQWLFLEAAHKLTNLFSTKMLQWHGKFDLTLCNLWLFHIHRHGFLPYELVLAVGT